MIPRLVICVPALAVLVLVAGCAPKDADVPKDQARPVLSMVVEPHAEGDVRFAGTIVARTQADLAFRLPGRLISRSVNVGDSVVADQVLAKIDASNLELAVEAAKANLASAQAQLDNAQGVEQRQNALYEGGNIPQAGLEVAQLRLKLAEATLSRAKGEVDKARYQLGYAQLRAEFSGIVTAVLAEPGSDLPAGRPVVTIADPTLRDAEIDLPGALAEKLDQGTSFEVALQLDPSIVATGTVREIAPEADPVTRTRRVKIGLTEPPDAFRIGATIVAKGRFGAEQPMEIPLSAVGRAEDGTFVWLIDPDAETVSMHKVVLGAEADGKVAVTQGLTAGMRIAVAGVESLVEGQKISIGGEGR